MSKRKNSNGFSLIEALFATAVLAFAIVPAISTFSSHIAAVHRSEADTAAWLHLENLCAKSESQLIYAPRNASGSVVLTEYANLSVTEPVKGKCGDCYLYRVSCKVMPCNGGKAREAEVRTFSKPPATRQD